jgi:hypothetical protein
MSFKTAEDQAAAIHAAHLELEKRRTIEAVYTKFPMFPPNDANDKAIIEIIARWIGSDVIPTADLFMSAYEENPADVINRMIVSPESKTRARLIEEICDLLRAPDPSGRGGRYSSFNIDSVRIKMDSWSLPQLQARKDEIVRTQILNKKPLTELKEMVHEAHRDTRRFRGYPNLPATIVPRGQVQAVRCDSAYLLNLARIDFHEYRRMVDKFGSDQITARQQRKI